MLPKYINSFRFNYFKLQNDLDTFLITDKQTKLSSLALSIRAGTLLDEYDGISKLVERVVFYGKDRNNEPNPFQKFIEENNGICKSNTYTDSTDFYFEIETKLFNQAIILFTQLLNKPFFESSSIRNEIKEIEAIYQKNLKRDSIRFKQLFYSLNELNLNGVGNAATWDINGIKTKLINHWKEHFNIASSSMVIYHNKRKLETKIMSIFEQFLNVEIIKTLFANLEDSTLTVDYESSGVSYDDPLTFRNCGTENSSEEEQNEASNIEDDKNENGNFNKQKQHYEPLIYDANVYTQHIPLKIIKNRIVYVKSNTRHHVLRLYVELPKIQCINEYSSVQYIVYNLNRNDHNSLYNHLYKKGFIFKYKCYLSYDWYFTTLNFKILLTNLGYANIATVLEIIKNEIINLEINEKCYYELKQIERKKLYENKFNYFFKNVAKFTRNMHSFYLMTVFEHNCLFSGFYAKEIDFLRYLISNNDNWLIILSSKNIFNNTFIGKNAKININDCLLPHQVITFRFETNKVKQQIYSKYISTEPFYKLKYIVGAKVIIENKTAGIASGNGSYGFKHIDLAVYKQDIVYISVLLNTKLTKIQNLCAEFYICMLIENFEQKHYKKMYFNNIKIKYTMTYKGVELKFSGFRNNTTSIVSLFFENFWNIETSSFYNIKHKLIEKYKTKAKIQSIKHLKKYFHNILIKSFCSSKKQKKILQKINATNFTYPKNCYIDMIVCANDQPNIYKELTEKLCTFFTHTSKFVPENKKIIQKTLKSYNSNKNICFLAIEGGKINDIAKLAVFNLIYHYNMSSFTETFKKSKFNDPIIENNIIWAGNMFYLYFYIKSEAGIEVLEDALRNYIILLNKKWNLITEKELHMVKDIFNKKVKNPDCSVKYLHKNQTKITYADVESSSYIADLNDYVKKIEIEKTRVLFGDIHFIKVISKNEQSNN